MPTLSERSLAERLGIKGGDRVAVLHAPKGYTSILGDLPDGVTMTTRLAGEPFAVIQAFYQDERALKSELRKLRRAIEPKGKIWICWRKAKKGTLGRDQIGELCMAAKLSPAGICSVDDDWSGLKVMLPKEERTK
jgi:hypothetical protein